MKINKIILCSLLLSIVLQAQDGELTLDPNDIPLTSDPTLEVPGNEPQALPDIQDTTQDSTLPPAAPTAPIEVAPAPEPLPPTIVPQVTTPAPQTLPPQRIEEFKPTPSNLEVKTESETIQREERFNKTYNKYHKSSTSSDNWQKVVGKRTADTYVVNKGDTLWDISGTLFGDPFYWPKVWSLNKELIYNPHVIFPDMKIKFFQGDSKSAPTLATDNQPAGASDEKKEIAKNDSDPASAPEIPSGSGDGDGSQADPVPKNESIKSTIRKLPRFFADKEIRIQKQVEIKIEERVGPPEEASINLEFYISEEPMAGVGKVIEVESEFKSAGEDQYVFIKMDAAPEGIYTVVKPGQKLPPSPPNTEKIEYNVQMHEVEGEVRILGRVNTSENVYRAQIIRSNTLVSEGSIVLPGRMKTFKISDSSAETTANKGRIIGNLNAYGIIGQGNFILINQGAQSGYQPSLKLPIFEDLGRRRVTSLVRENPMKVGTVLIVDATTNFSIGYVTRVTDRVVVNDLVAMPDTGEFSTETSANAESNSETALPPAEEPPPVEEF